jgi:long-subunit acyl-CoA synthetase (AMP-forming)
MGTEALIGVLFIISFETVKHVHITNEPFTADNGLLTATFKIKRSVWFLSSSQSDIDANRG